MELTDETAHRALNFVASVVDQGYRPTTFDLDLYLNNPSPRGPSLKLAGLGSSVSALMESYQRALATAAEETHEWLLRIGWLRHASEAGRLDITPLGRAVLRASNQQEIESDVALEVTLQASDLLAYAKVIGRIAQHGEALLVDPYFKIDHLLHIVQQTSIQRILVGEQLPKPERAQLAIAVDTLDIDRPLEIRIGKAAEMHDRFIIPESGPITTMGTSLTGVGKKFTVMQNIAAPSADRIREVYDKIWANAELLATSTPSPDVERSD